jgi:GT2 family glycosyltransferase
LDIILVNWNSGSRLTEAIASIAQHHDGLVSSVIVVDNASADDSLAYVGSLSDLPFPLHILRNPANRGFAAACNQGAALAGSEYLLFLNPDTRLFSDSLSAPLAFMRRPENAGVGIVGIRLIDEHDRVARSCARFPSLGIFMAQSMGLNRLPGLRHLNTHMSDWAHDGTAVVDHVIGAYYFIRRSLFESLGGFDERFFVYLEDLDLSLRARRAGWRSVYLADAQAFHAGGGTSYQVRPHRLYYSLRSRLYYGFKHFSALEAWILLGATLILEPVFRSVFSLVREGGQGVRDTWKGYAMLYKDMNNILRSAR